MRVIYVCFLIGLTSLAFFTMNQIKEVHSTAIEFGQAYNIERFEQRMKPVEKNVELMQKLSGYDD